MDSTTTASENFAAHCKRLLKDKQAADNWFGSDRTPCKRCTTGRVDCAQVLGRPDCGACIARHVKCSHQVDFLFDNSAEYFDGDRRLFDAEIEKNKIKRTRTNNVKTEDMTITQHQHQLTGDTSLTLASASPTSLTVASSIASPALVPLHPLSLHDTSAVISAPTSRTAVSPSILDEDVVMTLPDDAGENPSHCLPDAPSSAEYTAVGVQTSFLPPDARESPGHRLPKNPSSAEYTSVGVQTSLFAPDATLDWEEMDSESMRAMLSAYRSALQKLEDITMGYISSMSVNAGSDVPSSGDIANAALAATHRAHFEMMTCIFVARHRLAAPMPSRSRDLSDVTNALDKIQRFLGLLAYNLDLCREADPLLFTILDPTVPEMGYEDLHGRPAKKQS
ncbi:hypothetical protein C8J57DRAFT_1336689 [Mycena rebaudengoi]|nr:hypothetical protein C8J57DRAFT_1336689 [Mycena rebaudengoi]